MLRLDSRILGMHIYTAKYLTSMIAIIYITTVTSYPRQYMNYVYGLKKYPKQKTTLYVFSLKLYL